MKLVYILLIFALSSFAQEEEKPDGTGVGGGGFNHKVTTRKPSSIEPKVVNSFDEASKHCSSLKGQIRKSTKHSLKSKNCFKLYCSKSYKDDENKNYISMYFTCKKTPTISVKDEEQAIKTCEQSSGQIRLTTNEINEDQSCSVAYCSKTSDESKHSYYISKLVFCSSGEEYKKWKNFLQSEKSKGLNKIKRQTASPTNSTSQ